MADRDRQRRLGGADRRAPHAHPSLDERAEHREEPAVGVLDRAAVLALRGDLGVAVEQGVAVDADPVEAQAPVIDAVQAQLLAAIGDLDPGERRAVVGADRDQQRVHAARLAADDQLAEHRRQPPVAGGIADVVLARRLGGALDHELPKIRSHE